MKSSSSEARAPDARRRPSRHRPTAEPGVSARRVCLLLCTVGCGQPLWNPPAQPPAPSVPPPDPSEAIAAISLTRTACLGTCPHYALEFRAEGTATYIGYTDAPRIGTYAGRLDPAGFGALARTVTRNGIFEHPTSLSPALDAPATIIRVRVAGPTPRSKVISGTMEDYHYLWPLAARLDSIADTIAWEQVSADTLTANRWTFPRCGVSPRAEGPGATPPHSVSGTPADDPDPSITPPENLACHAPG